MPLRQAVLALHGESLVAEVSGSGIVVGQDPKPGKAVPHGSLVRITLQKRRFAEESAGDADSTKSLTSAVARGPDAR